MEVKEEEGRARRVAGRGLARPVLFLGRAEARCWRRARHLGTLGRRIAVSTEPSEPQPRLVLPEELRGDHLEPLHRDLVTESSVTHGPGHTGPC